MEIVCNSDNFITYNGYFFQLNYVKVDFFCFKTDDQFSI